MEGVRETLQRPPARKEPPRLMRLLLSPGRVSQGEGGGVRRKSTGVDGNRPTERSSVMARNNFLEQLKRSQAAKEARGA